MYVREALVAAPGLMQTYTVLRQKPVPLFAADTKAQGCTMRKGQRGFVSGGLLGNILSCRVCPLLVHQVSKADKDTRR